MSARRIAFALLASAFGIVVLMLALASIKGPPPQSAEPKKAAPPHTRWVQKVAAEQHALPVEEVTVTQGELMQDSEVTQQLKEFYARNKVREAEATRVEDEGKELLDKWDGGELSPQEAHARFQKIGRHATLGEVGVLQSQHDEIDAIWRAMKAGEIDGEEARRRALEVIRKYEAKLPRP